MGREGFSGPVFKFHRILKLPGRILNQNGETGELILDLGTKNRSGLGRSNIFDRPRRRTVRVLTSDCPCPVRASFLSGVSRKFWPGSVCCPSGRTRTRQSCLDFRCPCPPTSGPAYVIDTVHRNPVLI